MKKIVTILSGLVLTFVFAGTVSAAENWDVTGDWKFNYEYLGSYYEHSASLTQTGSTVDIDSIDSDGDGFTDADENYMGTDPNLDCGPNAWPPDFDDNQVINMFDVNQTLLPIFGSKVGDPDYSPRSDLDANGVINILDVSLTLPPTFGSTCEGSTVNGDGGYPAGGPYQYHWNITTGSNVTGDQVHLEMTYDLGVPVCDMTMDGDIAIDGTLINGTWSDNCWGITRSGTWTSSAGNATFNRRAEITAPDENEDVWGDVTFEAYLVDNDVDYIQWAVRQGTCAAGIGTVFGNVDGHSDAAAIDTSDESMQTFSFIGDMSAMTHGMYCFIYNPVEDSGESNIRETVEFSLVEPPVGPPSDKNECKKGDWTTFNNPSFKNQGDCVSFVATDGRNPGNGN